eukprot:7376289-Prymnesium_polylepis.1
MAARRYSFSATSTSASDATRSQPQSSWRRHGSCGTRRSGDVLSKTSSGQDVHTSNGRALPRPPVTAGGGVPSL